MATPGRRHITIRIAAGSALITPRIPDSIQKILNKASTQEKEAEQLARDARAARSIALRQLIDGGLTITDTAKLVKLSRQRVSQLITA